MNNSTRNLPPFSQMQEHATDAAGLMKALGNESRLMILCVLAEGERSVSDLNTIVPLSQSALSQQLARLRQQGLVEGLLKRGANPRRFTTPSQRARQIR
jgi:DNA-binding transcriptional ArsR family regulator